MIDFGIIKKLTLAVAVGLLAHLATGCGTTSEYRRCVIQKATTRCLPQCASCVRGAIEECQAQAANNEK